MSKWSEVDLRMLREHFPDSRTDDLALALGRGYSQVAQKAAALGLKKSAEYLASPAAHRLDGAKGMGTRFEAGQPAWNKGLKGVVGVQEACRATQFKKGRPASEARNYVPIGTERLTADGYLERKVTDDPSIAPARRWIALHRIVWEAVNGPIPAGHVVVFRPGMKTAEASEVTIDRLECITRLALMRRNSVHTIYPPEVARVVQLRGAINRQINKRAKHEQDDQRPA
jgi:hypothetical protein